MRYLKASALAFIIAAPGLAFASTAQAASECPVAGILSTWGINSAGVFNVASGADCLFPLMIEGVIALLRLLHKTAQRIHFRVHGKSRIRRHRYLLRSGDR